MISSTWSMCQRRSLFTSRFTTYSSICQRPQIGPQRSSASGAGKLRRRRRAPTAPFVIPSISATSCTPTNSSETDTNRSYERHRKCSLSHRSRSTYSPSGRYNRHSPPNSDRAICHRYATARQTGQISVLPSWEVGAIPRRDVQALPPTKKPAGPLGLPIRPADERKPQA
jgi:hypothetical protein